MNIYIAEQSIKEIINSSNTVIEKLHKIAKIISETTFLEGNNTRNIYIFDNINEILKFASDYDPEDIYGYESYNFRNKDELKTFIKENVYAVLETDF